MKKKSDKLLKELNMTEKEFLSLLGASKKSASSTDEFLEKAKKLIDTKKSLKGAISDKEFEAFKNPKPMKGGGMMKSKGYVKGGAMKTKGMAKGGAMKTKGGAKGGMSKKMRAPSSKKSGLYGR